MLKARQLAATHRLPLIPVHHMEAHALVARLGAPAWAAEAAAAEAAAAAAAAPAGGGDVGSQQQQGQQQDGQVQQQAQEQQQRERLEFPFLCLLVSGGHNLLLLVEGVGRYSQLGTTLDDALGAPAPLLACR